MHGNLTAELKRKNITRKAVADLIGCSERSVTNKINGTTEFTIVEAFAIRKNLLPEFDMDYIFASTSDA